jgi:voltage-gated potassium channel
LEEILKPSTEIMTKKEKTYEIIFGHHTPAGKAFDIILIFSILLSVVVVFLDSIPNFTPQTYAFLKILEWSFTFLFTLEYGLRIWCSKSPRKYAFSFFGIIDFLSIAPTYLSIFIAGPQFIAVFRILRLLRIFRILGLSTYVGQAQILASALYDSRQKIIIFLVTVLSIQTILGTFMFVIEGPEHGFTSIPMSIYWAVVTMTTVGYGDITPLTSAGKTLATFMMILGYAILAVPTGIVTLNLNKAQKREDDDPTREKTCASCSKSESDLAARFCKYCGTPFT